MNNSNIMAYLRGLLIKHINLIKYGVIGVMGLGIDFFVFFLAFQVFGLHYLIANALSVVLALTHNFLLNAFLNFKVRDQLPRRFMLYFSFGMGGLLLSSGGLFLLIEILNLNALVSKALMLGGVTLLQFILNKNITFKV